jgi:hypothetical protein
MRFLQRGVRFNRQSMPDSEVEILRPKGRASGWQAIFGRGDEMDKRGFGAQESREVLRY